VYRIELRAQDGGLARLPESLGAVALGLVKPLV
jgi:hypothetical protein